MGSVAEGKGVPILGRSLILLVAVAVVALAGAVGPASAQTDPCPETNPTDISPCGPIYVLPQWSNTAGWDAGPYYATIQAGDLDGDGDDELLGRGIAGMYVYEWNAAAGQWQLLSQGTSGAAFGALSDVQGWDAPNYYPTIQTADLDGDGDGELLARNAVGLHVYQWHASTHSFAQSGQPLAAMSDSSFAEPEYYTTIQTADLDGQGGDEVLARSEFGIDVYSWSGGQWTQVSTGDPNLSDLESWNQVQYYSTIQTANVDGQPGAELVARSAGGVEVWAWDESTTSFNQLGGALGPTSDGNDWNEVQYYSTIQTGDLDGDGAAELIGRGAGGMVVWKWDSGAAAFEQLGGELSVFSDDQGWAHPQYYLTIQTAQIDTKTPGVELLARGEAGIFTFSWSDATDSFTALNIGVPSLADEPWADPGMYQTIQTANVDGAPGAELIARGVYGMRTWDWSESGSTWVRPLPYGSFPAFAGVEAAAYTELNTFLGIQVGTVRDAFASPDTTPNTTTLNQYQSSLAGRCTNETSASPPTYASCSPPSGSGVSASAWTAVSNEIIAELYWAQQLLSYFNGAASAQQSLFDDEDGEFPAIANDLQLAEAQSQSIDANYLDVFSYVIDSLGLVIGLFDGTAEVGGLIELTADAIGAAADASDIPSGTVANQTYDAIQDQVVKNQETAEDTLNAQATYARGDYGLLRTVGALVAGQVLTFDAAAAQSAGRQAFALWVYQGFLPTVASIYNVSGCQDSIEPYVTTSCTPPPAGPYIQGGGSAGENFTAILDSTQTACKGVQVYKSVTEYCSFVTPPSGIVSIIWNAISSSCTYNPTSGSAWTYGCALAVPSTDLFGNQNGWTFPVLNCAPGYCSNGSANLAGTIRRARAAAIPGRSGSVTLSAVLPGAGNFDLADATARVDYLLATAAGGDLLLAAPQTPALPLELGIRSRHGTQGVTLSTPSRSRPSASMRVSRHRDDLLLALTIQSVQLDDPGDCSDGVTDELATKIVVIDSNDRLAGVSSKAAWKCRSPGQGLVRTLSLGN